MKATGGIASEATPGLRVRRETLRFSTRERVQLLDITSQVAEGVGRSGVREGMALLHSLHTTLALFVNEPQPALLEDVRNLLEEAVARERDWRHNDPRVSDCHRRNADAHLRAMLLGHSLVLPVEDGRLALGSFQAVILAELDGPRERSLRLLVLGSP